jgi:hypothetical protein
MRARDTPRAAVGWHTLGSLPESQEPLDPAPLPPLLPVLPAPNVADGAEPFHTIYGRAWYAARERSSTGAACRLAVDLLDRVESGWHAIRDLQQWFEAHHLRARQPDAYGHLLTFIGSDLVDVFREVAGGVADLVPGGEGWEAEADPDGVAGDVDVFVRYLALLQLAVQSAPVPEPFAVLVASVAERLRGWGDEVAALVSAWSAGE